MDWKKNWFWIIYTLILGSFVYIKIMGLFNPASHVYLYYYVIRVFNTWFIPYYILNIVQGLLHLLSFIVLILFIFRWKVFTALWWRYLFFLKIIFDIAGNGYEYNFYVSMYHNDPKVLGMMIGTSAIFYFPLYLVFFLYAFRQEKYLLK